MNPKEQDIHLQAIEENRKKNLDYINYEETDKFTLNGMLVMSVLDFWRFCYGALAGQSPMIAEFLVAKALGIEKAENVMIWTAYDMTYRNMRIEVNQQNMFILGMKKAYLKFGVFLLLHPTTVK